MVKRYNNIRDIWFSFCWVYQEYRWNIPYQKALVPKSLILEIEFVVSELQC